MGVKVLTVSGMTYDVFEPRYGNTAGAVVGALERERRELAMVQLDLPGGRASEFPLLAPLAFVQVQGCTPGSPNGFAFGAGFVPLSAVELIYEDA